MSYVLITQNSFVGTFETYNEALEKKTQYELEDLDTNSDIEYQILLQEDYITNKLSELRENRNLLENKVEQQGELWIAILKDLNEYDKLISQLK